MKRETDLLRALRVAVRAYGVIHSLPVAIEPVENKLGNGMFDVFLSVGGKVAWVELKCAGPEAKPAVRPGQPAFGARMWRAGITAVVLVGHPDGSCRILSGMTSGDDWRDRLLAQWSKVDCDLIGEILAL